MAESLKQQKERIKLEQEYQASLRISQSLIADIQSDIDKEVDYRTEIGKKLKQFNSDLKSSVSGLSDSASITQEIQRIEAEKDRIASSHFGKNKAIGNAKQEVLDTTLATLQTEQKLAQNTEAVNDAAQKYKESIGGALDKMTGHLNQVPVLGGMLASLAKKGADGIKNKLGKAAKQFTVDFKEGMEASKEQTGGLANALSKGGGSFLKTIFSWKTAMVGFVALLGASFLSMDRMQKTSIAFKQQTGILNGQFDGLNSKIASSATIALSMGASLEDGAKAAGDMFNAFGGVENISKAVLDSTTKFAVGMGISADSIGNVNKLFQNAFGHSQELAQAMVGVTIEASNLAGVPADKVLKDMAESSEEVYSYFSGSPDKLQKAAIQAAKLGTSIKQAAAVSKGLLDFESSINSELEASALLGTNINFNQARYLAANGDVLGSQQAVLKEVGKLGDLTKLNSFEQEALAKAAGMPIGDMINQQRIQRSLGKLKGDDLKAANDLIKSGKDLSKMDKNQLKAALANQKANNENNSAMAVLKGQLSSIGLKLGNLLLPLAKALTEFLQGEGADFLKVKLESLQKKFDAMGKWFNDNKPEIMNFVTGLKDGFITVKNAVVSAFDTIKPALNWIGNKLSGLSGEDAEGAGGLGKKIVVLGAAFLGLKMAFPLLKLLGKGIFGLGGKMLGLGKTVTKTASSSGGFLKTLGNGIKSIGQGLGGAIKSIASGMGSAIKSISSGIGSAIKSIASGMGSAMKSLGSGIGGFISSISGGIGKALSVIGKGLGGFLKGLSGGLSALANPAALIGLAAITLAFIGMAAALRIMAPALEPLGKMFKSIFEGIASIVVPVVEILVNGFTKLAEVIGGTIIGIFDAFGSIVSTLGETFVQIADIIGTTVLGIFDSVGATLGMIIENSGKAGQIAKMAAAIGVLGGALAAFGVGAGGGALVSGAGNFFGSLFDKGAEMVSGKKQASGPMDMIKQLTSLGPSLSTFTSDLASSFENFDLFIGKIESSITPIQSLTSALNAFSLAMFNVGVASKELDTNKIGQLTGMADASVGANAKLPELVSNLAEKIGLMKSDDAGESKLLTKLDELIAATVESRDVYLGKEKVTDVVTDTQETNGRQNRYALRGA